MIPLLVYAQLADLITFLFTASVLNIDGEYGLLSKAIYPYFGLMGVVVGKVFLVAAVSVYSSYWLQRRNRLGPVLCVIGIVIGTLGTLTNVASLAVSV